MNLTRQTLVVCIDNDILPDSVGGRIHRQLAAFGLPEGVRLQLLAGGASLLDVLGDEDLLVVVDAVHFGAPPGTVHRLDWPEGRESASRSAVREVGARDAIEVLRSLYRDRIPERVILIGVEGRFDGSDSGTDAAVAGGVERTIRAIRELIEVEMSRA